MPKNIWLVEMEDKYVQPHISWKIFTQKHVDDNRK